MTTYSKETAEAILEVGNREAYMEFKPDGVWTTEEQSGYEWTPACELDGPNAPDPLTTPSLPFPFTANELAAFMLDGIGWFTVDALGGWDEGPDPVVMDLTGIRGAKAREAVEGAYQAYRDAETVVGRFDGKALSNVQRLEADYEEARLHCFEEHGVGEAGITEAKPDARITLAYADVADKLASLKVARMEANAALGAWRKAMVGQLLQPQAACTPKEADTQWHLLATPAELIAAFGKSTGMEKAWFNKPEGKLLAARCKAGQGGKNFREPFYAVFAVMQWLIDPKRGKGNRITVATGWRILKSQFPKVYDEYQGQEPDPD